MSSTKPNIPLLVKQQAELYAAFISRFRWNAAVHSCLQSIHNTYTAYQESPDSEEESWRTWTFVAPFLKSLIWFPLKNAKLTVHAPVVVLLVEERRDAPVSNQTGFPVSTLVFYRRHRLVSGLLIFLRNVSLLPLGLFCSALLLSSRKLKRRYILRSLPAMLDFIIASRSLDLSGIRIILTHRDRYPAEIGVLTRARAQGVKTVRLDSLSPLDPFCHHTLMTDIHYYSNIVNRDMFERYEQNSDVKWVQGGLPSWDVLSEYPHRPDSNPQIVLFMGQFTSEQLCGTEDVFYAQEILSVLQADQELWIKVHPLDSPSKYDAMRSPKVRIISHGTIDNFELISRSAFCFSIFSALLFEAKHICSKSFLINYRPLETPHMDYEVLKQFVDHLKSRNDLIDALQGKLQPIPIPLFLERFNPPFPHGREALRKFVIELL